MRKIKLLVAATLLIFIVGCHKAAVFNTRQTTVIKEPITQKYNLQSFKSIALSGNTTVKLVNGSYAVCITDLEENLSKYQINVTNQTLHITAPKTINTTTIEVYAPKLKNLIVAGNVTVSAKGFKTSGLTVTTKGNGTVNLDGQYIIDKVYQRGNGRINISWINSDNLFVDSDSSGPIYLAGTANNMVIKLMNNAELDARYLRTQKASVFTTDNARADILVLDTLGAFAVDNSNIFYYKRPHNLTVVTKESGNVLHPDWLR